MAYAKCYTVAPDFSEASRHRSKALTSREVTAGKKWRECRGRKCTLSGLLRTRMALSERTAAAMKREWQAVLNILPAFL
jgi:hypothetical protein